MTLTLPFALRDYTKIVYVTDPQFGAVGDGTTNDTAALQAALDYCFGSASSPHAAGVNVYLNKVLYIPPGHYLTTDTLLVTKVHGGRIMGAGRHTTRIECTTPDIPVFETNGMQYSIIDGLAFKAASGGTCFNMDWDGNTILPGALQSNSFYDCFFEGGDFGLEISRSNYMGSENQLHNCYFISCPEAGFVTWGSNALQNQVWGGNFQGCGIGIHAAVGSVPVIAGVGFQQSSDFDIKIGSYAYDTYNITGCRTESLNFINSLAGVTLAIHACSQTEGVEGSGYFFDGLSLAGSIDSCILRHGSIRTGQHPRCAIRNIDLYERTLANWLTVTGTLETGAQIEIENILTSDGQIVKHRITPAGTFEYTVTAL